MTEIPLLGGSGASPVRVDSTIRRRPGLQTDQAFTHKLLRHFADCAWTGSPRFLGIDNQGREVLSYIDGYVAWETPGHKRTHPTSIGSDRALIRAAQLVREFHDLTAGTPFAGNQQVVCHSDLSPRNTVYFDEGNGHMPCAFIDWDDATPGPRVHDVAHMLWEFLSLGPHQPDAAEPARLMRMMLDAYGLKDRSAIVDEILACQEQRWKRIDQRADAGIESLIRLRELGVVKQIQDAHAWTLAHRAHFDHALHDER